MANRKHCNFRAGKSLPKLFKSTSQKEKEKMVTHFVELFSLLRIPGRAL